MKHAQGLGRIFKRHHVYWIAYCHRGKERRESTHKTTRGEAVALLKQRLGEIGRGELVGPSEARLTVESLLTDLVLDYEVNGRASLPTVRSHLKALRAAFGADRALDVTTARLQRVQRAWQDAGITNATSNRRCMILRRAFNLARQHGKLRTVPYFPHLEERSPLGRFISADVFAAIYSALPVYLQDFFAFAYWTGVRRGQLRQTTLANVKTDRWAIEWEPEQVKGRTRHTIPLEGHSLEIAKRLWASRRLDCPYVFHGPDCSRRRPGEPCLGDFKKAWAAACRAAGLPVGRKHGGYVFHHTRNTACTNMVGSGMTEGEAMAISGHKTRSVFDRYAIKREEVLRERLRQRTAYVEGFTSEPNVVPLPR